MFKYVEDFGCKVLGTVNEVCQGRTFRSVSDIWGTHFSGRSTIDHMSEIDETKSFAEFSSTGVSNSGNCASFLGSAIGSNDGSATARAIPRVAKHEQKFVFWSKLLVVLVLIFAMCAVATTTYLQVVGEERGDFEDQFAAYASEITSVSRQKANQLFSALDSFSVLIASEADMMSSNTTWPEVTIPHWSLKVTKFKNVIGADDPVVLFCPIVQENEKNEWAEYVTRAAPAWYQESIDNEHRNYTVDDLMTMTLPFIHFYDFENNFVPTPVSRPGPVLPVWQSYPFETDPVNPLLGTNYDLMTGQRIKDLFEITSAILSPTMGITQVITSVDTTAAESQIMQPIFKEVDTEAENRTLVGIIWLQLEWVEYFQDILVDGSEPVIVVLTSSCPKVDALSRTILEEVGVISYEINGPVATFLSETDAHDPSYDALEVAEVFVNLDVDPSKLAEGQCVPTLTLHVYPTKAMEDSFETSKSALYTGGVFAIFTFTSLIFLLYDFFVRRRQEKVMDRIVRQDKIVSDVFPSAIRDRLYGENVKQSKMNGLVSDDLDPLDFDRNSSVDGGAPLADLFPSTSVVFADIAGFTAWSSAREPQQVFILLENIYGAFDKIAYRHGVFKVETVGDCYVGVAGLPEPTEHHPVIACKFARDCLKKMTETTRRLEVSLGPDTSELGLRIGVHRYEKFLAALYSALSSTLFF
eukprot:scaffold14624_cov100-Cylindrotheca_fusiformis.AAC.4